MDIVCVNSKNDIFQLVNAQGEVLLTGTHDQCVDRLADFCREEEEGLYKTFLTMAGF
jgi:hypothetical protein